MRDATGGRTSLLRKPQLGNNFFKSGIVSKAALGPASSDLSGAVAASILGVAPGANGTTVFTVQHHWVTDAGHAIFFKLVEATVAPVALGFLALSRTNRYQRRNREVRRRDRNTALYRRSRPECRDDRAPVQRQSVPRRTVKWWNWAQGWMSLRPCTGGTPCRTIASPMTPAAARCSFPRRLFFRCTSSSRLPSSCRRRCRGQ